MKGGGDYDKPTEKITKPPEWEGAGAAVLRNIWGELYVLDQMDKILDKGVQISLSKGSLLTEARQAYMGYPYPNCHGSYRGIGTEYTTLCGPRCGTKEDA